MSLTSDTRDITELWETARYNLKLKFLQIPGVARVDLVGGRAPEYHVVVDPLRLSATHLSLADVTAALDANNLVAPAGMHEENHTLYLTVVDGRVHSIEDLENFVVTSVDGHPVRIRDFATVRRGPEPVFNVVTADGHSAVLLNIRSQPDGSTLDIAKAMNQKIAELRSELPPDMKLAFFYDQSIIVRSSVESVWEAILFGLILSVLILYAFLKNWGTTLVATTVIPVTVLITLLSMELTGLTFNLMTLGGIAAAIGLVIDDAIVVVEAIHTRLTMGSSRTEAVETGIGEILRPLIGSTLTPVVVFIPLAFLQGLTGVFFRALALTMVVSLLTSLALAVTLTPSLAAWLIRPGKAGHDHEGWSRAAPPHRPVRNGDAARPPASLADHRRQRIAAGRRRAAVSPARQRVPAADGRGRLRHRLFHATGHQPGRDQSPAAPGRADPADRARSRELLAPHRRASRAGDRRAEYRRLPGEAPHQPEALDR